MTSPPDEQQPEHLERDHYERVADALRDAEQCAFDLRRMLQGQLLVRSDDLDFVARRLQQLVHECRAALPIDERIAR